MNKTFRNSAIALTIMGGAALFAVPTSANPLTHDTSSFSEVSKSVGLTDVGWRRQYRRWGPPAYYGPPPAYGYGPRFYGPGPGFSVYVD